MALKRVAAAKTRDVRPKTAATKDAPKPSALKKVWALPTALAMVTVAATALWLGVRESSNTPQAAARTMAPESAAAAAPAAADRGVAAEKKAAPAEDATAAETTPASAAKPVSIVGCVQRGDGGFVLKNVEGTAAPKARSWKSGFLKRSTASIQLRDVPNAARIGAHVGHRVSLTGVLADREMRVQSLRHVEASCR